MATQRKGAPEKVSVEQRLRQETTTTLARIAVWLQIDKQTHLSHLLYWHRREEKLHKTIG